MRRARALQDVMLPELERSIYEIENRLEELNSIVEFVDRSKGIQRDKGK